MNAQKLHRKYPLPSTGALLSISLFIILLFSSGCSHLSRNNNTLFQVSTLGALSEGDFSGDRTYGELKKHGDTGLGTFDGLDGEMIGLDGTFYQVRADGSVHPVDDSMNAPFAEVTFFAPDRTIVLNQSMNSKQFDAFLDDQLPTKNIFFVFKIEGVFSYIKARSVPKQNKPYPSLAAVISQQSVFEFHNIRGTIIGFRCPAYTAGINAPGYHFHFISADRKAGGHVLDLQVQDVKIGIDEISKFTMVLPGDREFYSLDLSKTAH